MTDLQLAHEYLPARGAARQNVVLLHGWASSREIWRPLLPKLHDWANVTLIDLPGCTSSRESFPAPKLEALEQAILACAPKTAVYVGWSLGGQLATGLAGSHPDRVSALVTLCANPRFIGGTDWPGMAPADFRVFRIGFETDMASALQRFDSLQTRGSSQPRPTMRALACARQSLDRPQLLAALELLETLDLRRALVALKRPQLHLFGRDDALVPAAVPRALGVLLEGVPDVQITSFPSVCHAASLEAGAEIVSAIYDFLSQAGVLCEGSERAEQPAKTEISESFSRAARHYDSAAQLQREVGTRLLKEINAVGFPPETVLDLGCGTGFFYDPLNKLFPNASYLGLDLAPGMVEFARVRCPEVARWLVADAESLPFAANSVDLVFSSLAIQWCHSPQRLFAELARVLRPGGRCLFTSLGPDTLKELRASWASVDGHQHVNTFLPPSALEQAARDVVGVSLRLHNEQFQMKYDRVRELLDELRTLGAHNMNRGRRTGLTGRRALQGMLTAYETWREGGKLPATYDVLFGVLEKA
jgi:malonyl-CoA O-methyltransferase